MKNGKCPPATHAAHAARGRAVALGLFWPVQLPALGRRQAGVARRFRRHPEPRLQLCHSCCQRLNLRPQRPDQRILPLCVSGLRSGSSITPALNPSRHRRVKPPQTRQPARGIEQLPGTSGAIGTRANKRLKFWAFVKPCAAPVPRSTSGASGARVWGFSPDRPRWPHRPQQQRRMAMRGDRLPYIASPSSMLPPTR